MKADKRLLQEAKTTQGALTTAVFLGLSSGLLLIVQAYLLSLLISDVFLNGRSLTHVWPLLAGYAALGLLRAGCVWGSDAAAHHVAGSVKHALRQRLADRLLRLGPHYAKGQRSGELINTAVSGIEALDAYLSQYLPQLFLTALLPLAILLVVFPLDWLSGLVLLFTAPLIPLFMALIGHLAGQKSRQQWQTLSRLSAVFLDVLQGLTTLKLLNRSRQQVKLIRAISDRFREKTMDVLRVAFLSALVLEMVATLSIAVLAVEIGVRLLGGGIPFQTALFLLVLAPEFYLPLRQLGARFHASAAGVAAADRIFAVLNEPLPAAPAAGQPFPAAPFAIQFEGVHMRYDREHPALHDLSLTLTPGEHVALIGPSGAGKSTVADLLLGFVAPDDGRILVNGVDLRALDPAQWRRQIAWVSQRPYLFNESVADNIRRACPAADFARVVAAAKQAQAHAFIQALPDGYDTIIGEQGARLSGGQAQRLALARAFLKDAPILILDEATSNLDAVHEAALTTAVRRLMHGRTVLTISHRLHTVTAADRILLLANGRLAAAGAHEALQQESALYRRLVQAYGASDTAAARPALPHDEGVTPVPPPVHTPDEIPAAGTAAQTVARLLRLARPFAGRIALAALLGFATIASSVGLMASSGYIISKAALRPGIAAIQLAIVSVRFFGVSRGVFRYLERLLTHDVTFRLLARLRVWFYEGIEPLAPARLSRAHSGDLLSRIVGDVEALQEFFPRVIAPPLIAVVTIAATAVFLSIYSLPAALAAAAFLLLAALAVPGLSYALSRRAGPALVDARARLVIALVDHVQGVADVLALGQEAAQQRQIAALSARLAAWQQRMAHIAALSAALTGLLLHLATAVVLWIVIPQVSAGALDGVLLAVLALATMAAFEAVLPLSPAVQYLQSSVTAANRLFELVGAEPAVRDAALPSPTPLDTGICVRDLRFAYDGGAPALDGVSFDAPANGRVAIVGPSGAGKSTLVNLLLRFYPLRNGRVLLGGYDLAAYRQEDVRELISVVSQRTHLFNGTVRDNLLLARPAASEAEMVAAAQQAQIHDFIAALPQGYDTWIGEQGLTFSGGERQRLAIARALLRDAPILILDEATANLDALAEQQVLQAVETAMRGRTTLIITHRLTGLETADQIVVLRNGRVVQQGTHAGLLARPGLYRRMWSLQQVNAESV